MRHTSATITGSQPSVPPIMSPTNSANFAPVPRLEKPQAGGKHALLDFQQIRAEYNLLKQELDDRELRLVQARHSFAEAVEYMSRMQSLLSRRAAGMRSLLHRSKVPSWTKFISQYAARVGYSVRQLTSMIHDYRDAPKGKRSKKPSFRSCKPVLCSLLDWSEYCGDHIPVILVDVCRNADAVLAGRCTLRQWRENEEQLHQRARRATIIEHDPEGADSPATPKRPYTM